jgi:TolA-binding protein
MSRTQTTLTTLLVLLAVAAPQWIAAQAPKEPEAAAEGEEDAKSRGRLPNLYGKLGVSEVQRERIYAIQGEYNAKIDDLLAQVEELRGERETAMEAVLTNGQRQRLKELRDEAAKERAKRDR